MAILESTELSCKSEKGCEFLGLATGKDKSVDENKAKGFGYRIFDRSIGIYRRRNRSSAATHRDGRKQGVGIFGL